MIKCKVEIYYTAWLVTFADGSTTLIQSDWNQAQFAVDCGAIKAPPNWDGIPSRLPGWDDFRPEVIAKCPEEYKGLQHA